MYLFIEMGYLTDLELVSLFLLSNKLGWLAGESQSSTCLQLPRPPTQIWN